MTKLKNSVTLLLVLLLISLLHAQTTNPATSSSASANDPQPLQLLDLTQLLKALNMTQSDLLNLTGDSQTATSKPQVSSPASNPTPTTQTVSQPTNNNMQLTQTSSATKATTATPSTAKPAAGASLSPQSKPVTANQPTPANSNANSQIQSKATVQPATAVTSKTTTASTTTNSNVNSGSSIASPINQNKATPAASTVKTNTATASITSTNSQTTQTQNKPTTPPISSTASQVKTPTQQIPTATKSMTDKVITPTQTAAPIPNKTTSTTATSSKVSSAAADQLNFSLMDLSSLEALLGISSFPTTPTTPNTTSTTTTNTSTSAISSTQLPSAPIVNQKQISPSVIPVNQTAQNPSATTDQSNSTPKPVSQTTSTSSPYQAQTQTIPSAKSIVNSIDLSVNKAASQSTSDNNAPIIGPGPLDPSLPPVLDLSKIIVDFNPNPKSASNKTSSTSSSGSSSPITAPTATPIQAASTINKTTSSYSTSSNGISTPSQTWTNTATQQVTKPITITAPTTTPTPTFIAPTIISAPPANSQKKAGPTPSSQTITDPHLISSIDSVQLPGWTVDVNKISDAKATQLEYTSLSKQTQKDLAPAVVPSQTIVKSANLNSNSYSSSASAVPVPSVETSSNKFPAILKNIPNLVVDYSVGSKQSKTQQSVQIVAEPSAVSTRTPQQNIEQAIQQTIRQAAASYQQQSKVINQQQQPQSSNQQQSQSTYQQKQQQQTYQQQQQQIYQQQQQQIYQQQQQQKQLTYQQPQPAYQQQQQQATYQQQSVKQIATPVISNESVYRPAISTSSQSRYQPTPTIETKAPVVQPQVIITKPIVVDTPAAKPSDNNYNQNNIYLTLNNYQAPVPTKQTVTSQLRKENDDEDTVQSYQRPLSDKTAIYKIAANYKTFSTSFILSNTDEHLNTLQQYLFNNYGNYISQGKLIAGFKLYNTYAPSIDYQLVYETSFGTFNSILTYFCDNERIQLKSLSVINYFILEIDYSNCKSKDSHLLNCQVCNAGYRNFMGRCREYDSKCLTFLTDECGACKNGYKLTKGVCV